MAGETPGPWEMCRCPAKLRLLFLPFSARGLTSPASPPPPPRPAPWLPVPPPPATLAPTLCRRPGASHLLPAMLGLDSEEGSLDPAPHHVCALGEPRLARSQRHPLGTALSAWQLGRGWPACGEGQLQRRGAIPPGLPLTRGRGWGAGRWEHSCRFLPSFSCSLPSPPTSAFSACPSVSEGLPGLCPARSPWSLSQSLLTFQPLVCSFPASVAPLS